MRPGVAAAAGVGPRRWFAGLMLGAMVAGGCAAFGRAPLDVPPGHQAVLGEVFVVGFSEPSVVLDIGREDGSYRLELPVDGGRSQFVITLPPGRYRISRLRLNESRRSFPEEVWFQVGVGFEVGATAVYVGTLRIEHVAFGRQVRVTVQDEYERTVPAARARYPDLPSVVARTLMRPA